MVGRLQMTDVPSVKTGLDVTYWLQDLSESSPGHLPSPKWSKMYVDIELTQCYTFHTALTLTQMTYSR